MPLDWTCNICGVFVVSQVTTACRHLICLPCVNRIRARSADAGRIDCPMCRTVTTVVQGNFLPQARY